MDPSLGHLYHDSSIRGTFTTIDAKEKLRMRGINAREQRHLDRQTYILDKAKLICERSRKLEQEKVQRLMRHLRDRTQSLELLLKREAECANFKNRYESKLISSAPTVVSKKSVFAKVPPLAKSAGQLYPSKEDSRSKSNSFKRRSNIVVRSLVKLYDRSGERKRQSMEQIGLAPGQVTTLLKARATLRGTEAEADVEQLLERSRGVQGARYCHVIGQSPAESNCSKSDGYNGNTNSSMQSVLEEHAGSQLKVDSAVVWTHFQKLPQI